ncbi:MAG: alpha-ketoglutarate-dependent dioxygenase AlkB [Xanthomonadales bacterium]|nr:alpha-ketoglutarate-dependent dioxygenase AlkB [Xanthomonadales bacterium]
MLTWHTGGGFQSPSSFPPPLPYADCALYYFPDWIAVAKADALFDALNAEIPWQQRAIQVYGRQVMQPRLTAWIGDESASYSYSKTQHLPEPWTPTTSKLRHDLEQSCQWRFNSVLANCYRNGEDSMGWHADNEAELGQQPVIASLTLGAARRFVMRRRDDHQQKFECLLAHGSLLVMAGETQQYWQHSLPKSRKVNGARINLTYRWICQAG